MLMMTAGWHKAREDDRVVETVSHVVGCNANAMCAITAVSLLLFTPKTRTGKQEGRLKNARGRKPTVGAPLPCRRTTSPFPPVLARMGYVRVFDPEPLCDDMICTS